jgi:ribosome maturation protein Sdo1
VIYLTTKTESEIKDEEINTLVYPEYEITYIIDGRKEMKTYYLQGKFANIKEIATNGTVTITPVKRKRILEEHYSDLIAGFTAEEIDFENESEATAKILRDYKVVVDSVTQVKTLVLRG